MDLEACARGEENLASASDTVVVVLGEVWRGSFLPREPRLLPSTSCSAEDRIEGAVALPPGATFKRSASFGGENDAGLVLLPGRTFALAVLVEGGVERALPAVAAAISMICGVFAACR